VVSRAALALALLACAAVAVAVTVAAQGSEVRPQSGPTEFACPALSALERDDVLKGKILLRELDNPSRKGRTYEAVGILSATLEKAISTITDYRHYAEFMPRVDRVVVTDESDSVSLVEQYLKLPLGVSRRYRLRYTVMRGEAGFRIEWVKVAWPEVPLSQSVVETSGHWQVGRFADGQLLALYHVYTDPGRVPFGMKSLAMSISKHDIPKIIEKVRQRLRLRAAPGPVKDGLPPA
jgi:hypothetical protein